MKQSDSNNNVYRYIGLATQFLVAIGLSLIIGMKADKWLSFKMPLLVWVLPLFVIVAMIWHIIKETSKK